MTTWREKLQGRTRARSTANTAKSPPAIDRRLIGDFLRLVRITGVCEYQLLLDDKVILAELDADDLRELAETTREGKQAWAQLLAYRLTRARIAR